MDAGTKPWRAVGYGEGFSYLALLFVAMPLKYLAGLPAGVRVAGSIHGILFVAYLIAVVLTGRRMRWSYRLWIEAVAASVIPFGPFLLDRKLRRIPAEVDKTRPRSDDA